MKSLVFDTGAIISFATNNLLTLLPKLKEEFGGEFFIPPAVKHELIDVPLAGKKFKFEALQVQSLINDKVLIVRNEPELQHMAEEFASVANVAFKAKGNAISIVHAGELEVVALAKIIQADAIVIDERTIRWLIERPQDLHDLLGYRLRTAVSADATRLKTIAGLCKGLHVIRSAELATLAFEKGFLNHYLAEVKEPRRVLIDAMLWALKLRGCAISRLEIDQLVKLESHDEKTKDLYIT